MHGREGACVAGGVHATGAYVPGGVHARGHAWQGECAWQGGVCGTHAPTHPREQND